VSAIYLETSAFLRILFQESEYKKVEEKIKKSDFVVSSRLLKLEVERALIRYELDHPGHKIKVLNLKNELKNFWAKINFIELTENICELAGRIASDVRLRSLDALHTATFFYLKEQHAAIEILSFDSRIKSVIT